MSLIDKNDDGERFISLSGDLYHQRLIYGEPRELRKVNGNLELTVIFLDKNSFEKWLDNTKIIENWNEIFSVFLRKEPKTLQEPNVIIEIDKVQNCSCKNSKFYFLQGRTFQFISELICGDCLDNVPYSRIPLSIEIENWQKQYQRIYLNWLDSSFLENSAKRQLLNYKNGKLNIEGEKIRKQLADFLESPVYLKFFTENPDEQLTCIICGLKGIKSGLRSPKKICKNCNTAFDYSEN